MSALPEPAAPQAEQPGLSGGPTAVPDAEETRPLTALPDLTIEEHGRLRSLVDRLLALALLVGMLPVIAVVALLILSTSRGPVFFRQQRVGQGGALFDLVKFRTMYADAEQRAAELFALMDDGNGPLHKLHRDPRVTPVGRWLRRLSIDELPQLWNVVTGTMALVGPRPNTPHEVARFRPEDLRRHAVRPGMTGLAQINGRSDLEWDEAVRLDLEYVERRSVWLDLRILLRTLPAVFGGRGAY